MTRYVRHTDLQPVIERLARIESSLPVGGGVAALSPVLNVQDLAKILRTTPNAIRVMSCRGQLPPPLRLPGSKRLLWSERVVAEWLNEAESRQGKPQ